MAPRFVDAATALWIVVGQIDVVRHCHAAGDHQFAEQALLARWFAVGHYTPVCRGRDYTDGLTDERTADEYAHEHVE